MKRLCICLLLCLLCLPIVKISAEESVKINKTNFPDKQFRNVLTYVYDTDSDGYLSEKERTNVEYMSLDGYYIKDITGIKHFPNLKFLTLKYNSLSDFSEVSSLKKLEYLSVDKKLFYYLDLDKVYADVVDIHGEYDAPADYRFPLSAMNKSWNHSMVKGAYVESSYLENYEKDVEVTYFKSKKNGIKIRFIMNPNMETPKDFMCYSNSYKTIGIKFDKDEDSIYTEIYQSMKLNGTYKKIKTTKSNNTVVYVETGKDYFYKARSYKNVNGVKVCTKFTSIFKCKALLSEVQNVDINLDSASKLKLSWNSVEGAHGYQIYSASSMNGTYKKICTTKKNTAIVSINKSQAKYFYKIRAYRTVDNQNVYGKFGTIEKVLVVR